MGWRRSALAVTCAVLAWPASADAVGLSQARGGVGSAATAKPVGSMAVSPNGRWLYVATPANGRLLVFRRTRSTGALRRAGAVRGIAKRAGIALTPDGRDLYVTDPEQGTVTQFRRNRRPFRRASVTADPLLRGDPNTDTGPGEADVTTAARGRIVLVTYEGTASTDDGTAAVVAFRRDPSTGELERSGCLVAVGADGCPGGAVLRGDPDSGPVVARERFVYVTGVSGVTLARLTPAGTLRPVACFDNHNPSCVRQNRIVSGGMFGPPLLAVPPGGRQLLVTAFTALHQPYAHVWFGIDADTGRLGASRCLALRGNPLSGCDAHGRSQVNDPGEVAFSPDGRLLALSSAAYPSVGVMARDLKTGALTPVSGRTGCLGVGTAYRRACARGHGLAAAAPVVWSPDSRFFHVGGERGVATIRISG